MDKLRKIHNNCKKELINQWVRPGSLVLDCGCGRGGDWWKWKAVRAKIVAIDPDLESLKEADKRAKEADLNVFFLGRGDIRHAAFAGPYDVVCYNFSVHYIFENEEIFKDSIRAIACALKPGGLLIGITPEKARADALSDEHGRYKDPLENQFEIWRGGRRLMVKLSDGPFYGGEFKDEPLLDANKFVKALEDVGLSLIVWDPMISQPNGHISDLYSKFVFKKIAQE